MQDTTTNTTSIMIFDTIQALYEDMIKHYQSFIKFENELNTKGNKAVILGESACKYLE